MKRKSVPLLYLIPAIIVLIVATTAPATFATVKTTSTTTITLQPIKSNYTGYVVVGNYTTLRVKGTWIVPTANCTATPNSVSNISVVIDGINGEHDAMEIGTYQDCSNGVASYGAFLNVYPETGFYGNKTSIDEMVIRPGDVIEAQGTWRSPGQPVDWNTNIVDETTCTQLDTDAHTAAGFAPVQDSGALILSSDGHNLTSLSTIQSGEQYTESTAHCAGNIQGTSGSDITGPEQKIISFGTQGSTAGFTLDALQIPGTSITPLYDGGTSFEITGA